MRVLEVNKRPGPVLPDDIFPAAVEGFTKAPPGTNAARLERALHYGFHMNGNQEEVSNLFDALEHEVSQSVESLRRWTYVELAKIDDALTRMADG